MTLRLAKANPDDLSSIEALIDETARWLGTKGTDQWAKPWPTPEGRRKRIQDGLTRGTTWLMWASGLTEPVATVTVEREADTWLWSADERAVPATYVHRLIVRRAPRWRGLGGELLRWVSHDAALLGHAYLRIDVWTTNHALHAYYRRHGFQHVRTSDRPDYPSGMLLQRRVRGRERARYLPFVVDDGLQAVSSVPVPAGRETELAGVAPLTGAVPLSLCVE